MVAIVIFAWQRMASLQRVVNSLLAAEYCGFKVTLIIILDANPAPAAVEYARTGFEWPHGPRRVVTESSPNGIRGMWTRVLTRELERESEATHVLPIEDDIQVSPLFHWWLRRAAVAYGPFDTAKGSLAVPKLVGVSLYSPRSDEIHYPMRVWKPRHRQLESHAACFFFGLPCSWGALYFREHWRRFIRFYHLRGAPPFYNFTHEDVQGGSRFDREVLGDPVLGVPNSRHSTWPRSWKKFLIDYMYGRGDVMLYPSAPLDPQVRHASMSFSTTYMERGDHTGSDGKIEGTQANDLRAASTLDYRKTVPLLLAKHAAIAVRAFSHIPSAEVTTVLSLLHENVASIGALQAAGHNFVNSRAHAAERRHKNGDRPSAEHGDDMRPCTQLPGSPRPTRAQYENLARVWLDDDVNAEQ